MLPRGGSAEHGDQDGDQKLDAADLVKLGASAEEAAATIARADKNGDGKIGVEEIIVEQQKDGVKPVEVDIAALEAAQIASHENDPKSEFHFTQKGKLEAIIGL